MSDLESEPVIYLHSNALLSKWGFNDGDTPDEIYDYMDERGIDYSDLPPWPLQDLVREYLLPELGQAVEITVIETNHNPVRAVTVDGREVVEEWYDNAADRTHLTPESVSVPIAEVVRRMQAATTARRCVVTRLAAGGTT